MIGPVVLLALLCFGLFLSNLTLAAKLKASERRAEEAEGFAAMWETTSSIWRKASHDMVRVVGGTEKPVERRH
jgi:hypothetical protein